MNDNCNKNDQQGDVIRTGLTILFPVALLFVGLLGLKIMCWIF